MKNLKKNDGFTLIEILVVIGIIAILAVIVLIAINPARQFKQARDTQRTSNVNAILNGVGQYIADHKGGPVPGLPLPGVDPVDAVALCGALVSDYLPALPTDPNSNIDGGDIDDCTVVPLPNTNYNVSVDADSERITVSADAEIDLNDDGDLDNDVISVTR